MAEAALEDWHRGPPRRGRDGRAKPPLLSVRRALGPEALAHLARAVGAHRDAEHLAAARSHIGPQARADVALGRELASGPPGEGRAPGGAIAGPSRGVPPAYPSLDEAMRAHIEAALERTRGRIEGARGAAALLRINPHTLRARMRRLGIPWARFRSED